MTDDTKRRNRRPSADKKPAFTIGCMENPFDIRPAVEMILSRIDDARERLRDTNTPIVVLLGERHDLPSNLLLQVSVINEILNQPKAPGAAPASHKLATGLELPLNFLGESIGHPELDGHKKAALSRLDPDGRRSLSALLAYNLFDYAPLAHASFYNYLYETGVSTRFNDLCSYKDITINRHGRPQIDALLDQNDPFTRDIVSRLAPEALGEDISVFSILGGELRNASMVERGMAHIRDTNAEIYVAPAGLVHLMGVHKSPFTYKKSLTSLFQKAGAHVVPVFVASPESFFPPDDALQHLADGCIILGLSDQSFNKQTPHEKEHIEKICEESALDLEIFGAPRPGNLYPRSTHAHHQERVKSNAEYWLQEMYNSLEA